MAVTIVCLSSVVLPREMFEFLGKGERGKEEREKRKERIVWLFYSTLPRLTPLQVGS